MREGRGNPPVVARIDGRRGNPPWLPELMNGGGNPPWLPELMNVGAIPPWLPELMNVGAIPLWLPEIVTGEPLNVNKVQRHFHERNNPVILTGSGYHHRTV